MYGFLISTVTVGAGGAASIDFTGIPNTYTDLILVYAGRSATDTSWNFNLKVNGVVTSMSARYVEGNGAGASSGTRTIIAGIDDSSGATANTFSNTMIYIPQYAASTNKTFAIDTVAETNNATAYMEIAGGQWSSSAAITSLSIYAPSGNLAQYSTASLYGINSGTSGGTVVA